jgi:ABC-type antimicrobial peptide transport system permease subunit
MYTPMAQCPYSSLAFASVRSAGTPQQMAASIRHVVAALDPTMPVSDVRTLHDRVARTIDTTRFSTFLASLFAMVAALLGAVGVYSVLAYIVSQSRHDVAIRIALGASPREVVVGVMRRAVVLTGVGIAIGSLSAWIVTRLLAGLFLGVAPHDPVTFLSAAVGFALLALSAAAVPAVRSARTSPAALLATM